MSTSHHPDSLASKIYIKFDLACEGVYYLFKDRVYCICLLSINLMFSLRQFTCNLFANTKPPGHNCLLTTSLIS